MKKTGFRHCNTFHYTIVVYLSSIQQIKANTIKACIMPSATDADKCINKSWSSLEFLNQYFPAWHVVYCNFTFSLVYLFIQIVLIFA